MSQFSNLPTDLSSCRYEFPSPEQVDTKGVGLIAMGGDLSASTLICAYSQGLFPWFNEDEPIAWWCPEPRCIIEPQDYKPSKSLMRQARKSRWTWTVNQAFDEVIHACSLPRSYESDTWIHEEMIEAYSTLHHLGYAHSIEIWENQCLVGGLYGLKIGAIFFGESMFHHASNASKMAFWALTHLCHATGVQLIDCQLPNDHLLSLGATTLPRTQFLVKLSQLIEQPTKNWQQDFSSHQSICQLATSN